MLLITTGKKYIPDCETPAKETTEEHDRRQQFKRSKAARLHNMMK